MKEKFTPLPGSFMLVGMFMFLFAVFFVQAHSLPWAFIIGTFGVILFGASLLSMTFAPVEDELILDSPSYERDKQVEIISAAEAVKRMHHQKTPKSGKKKAKKKTTKSTGKKK